MKSAVALSALAASAQAGGIRGSDSAVPVAASPVPSSPGAVIAHHEATSKLSNAVPMAYSASSKSGYTPTWAGAQMNANVKAIKDSWQAQEGRLGYYGGHFGYGPSVHPELHTAYQYNPFQTL